MSKALIGSTGFVGGNLQRQTDFEYLFNSRNIEKIKRNNYDLVVCAAPSAVKWEANQFPDNDLRIVNQLIDDIKNINTEQFVQISTIDVYKTPYNVDEKSKMRQKGLHPYGKHRLLLEEFVKSNFKNHLIIRLPGLFGEGLKKNFIFDMLNNHALDYTHEDSLFQFFALKNLWEIITIALGKNLDLVNITSEPITAKEVAQKCFDMKFKNAPKHKLPACYNVKTIHAELFGGKDGYIYTKEEIIEQIKAFIGKK
ncbi:sugar nucleotide-binding protein [Candidatus Dojkabacteria bacterium]|nr:sugar nucleotide-binding protein [Candidatus Dojkabacteria bacterium]